MWRSIFLAVGITLILLGGQLFFVEQLEIKRVRNQAKPQATNNQVVNFNNNNNFGSPFQNVSTPAVVQPKTILYTPKDWMPWSLLAVGAIVVIYTFTIPRRSRYSEE